jgi:enoyl-CoA hydratase/carnithine racemase
MMVLTGKSFSAQEMKLFGLVTEVDSDVKTLARAEAKKIIQNGPLALKALKRLAETPAHELEEESKQFAALFNTQDQKEGMAAFLSKRTASFQQL